MKDKIIFWLGNDYTHFCLACALQKIYDCQMYGITEVAERANQFFQNQKLVNFEKIWFFHDEIKKRSNEIDMEYLSQCEKKYKVDLWKLVQNERNFLYFETFHKFSSDEILQILEQECRFFDNILEKIKPNFLFTKIASSHHHELFYRMCKNSGVKVQVLNYSTLAKNCIFTQDPMKLDYTENLENIKDQNRNFEDLQDYLHSFDILKEVENKILKPGTKKSELLKAGKEFLLHYNSENRKSHYPYYGRTKFKVFFYYLNYYFKTKLRKSFIDKNLTAELKNSEPFVFFPLQTEMERSILIAAPFYTDQIETIKCISKSLPINFKLYVKEHPAQIGRGWRTASEYKQIMNIPNVVLFHPNFPNDVLYKNCSLSITVSGRTGFEAALYGKPVITFVDMQYSMLPSVHTLKNLETLPELIRTSVSTKVEPSDLDRYISLLEKNICKFDYADFQTKMKEEFFYSGNLLDVKISESKMKSFLEKNESSLEILANDHIKKINWLKGNSN